MRSSDAVPLAIDAVVEYCSAAADASCCEESAVEVDSCPETTILRVLKVSTDSESSQRSAVTEKV